MTSLEQADLEAALRLIGEASPHYLATLSEELLHNVRLKIACTLSKKESAYGDKDDRTAQTDAEERPASLQTWLNKVERTVREQAEAKRKATAATFRNLEMVKRSYSDIVFDRYYQWKKNATPSLIESWHRPGKGKRRSDDAVQAFCKYSGSTSSSKLRENLCIRHIVEEPSLNHVALLIGYNSKEFLKHRLSGDFTDKLLQHEDLHRLAEEFVQQMMDKFMVRGSHSPMQWMLDLRTYGLKIHYNTTSRGHVEWVGQDELLYKEVQFTMAQFRGMVHGLRQETRRLLMEDLLFSNRPAAEPVPSIPWENLRDNPTDERPGWNFLKDQRTRLPVDGERWLVERVGQIDQIKGQFMKPGTRSGVDQQEVTRYMDRVVAFREKLIVLMHMTGGQPARGPEIMSIRHSNTVKGAHRNIFIEDGKVVFVTRYHKGYVVSGDVKIIHRYLPREVGELVVYYLWLVLPFQQRMEALVWEKEAMSSHMWPADPNGRKWTTDRMREALKRETSVGLGQPLTVAAYREIAIGISRRFLRGSTAF
ncbi:hypothetical protein PMIN02_011724 [Paraphaeosphaeria minitans]